MAVAIFAILFWVVAFVALISIPLGGGLAGTGTMAVCAIIGLVIWFGGSINTVGTKDIGVITSYGKPQGHLNPGLHLLWPWQNVTTMDAAIQTDSYQNDSGCITIHVANQQKACAHLTIRWRIRPDQADYLFQNYRTFNQVRDSLVTKELINVLNDTLANYNPLDSVSLVDANGKTAPPKNPPTPTFGPTITREMQKDIGQHIEVLSVYLPYIGFDQETQNRLNQLQQQVAQTRISTQEIATNQAQAKANAALATSVNKSPNVLVAECMAALTIMAKAGDVPVGFSCWPGGSTVSGIIAPSH